MHRLLVPSETLACEHAVLPPDAARHLKVLRPNPGERLELFDGRGRTRTYRFTAGDATSCVPPGRVAIHCDHNAPTGRVATCCDHGVPSALVADGDIRTFPPPAVPLVLFACVTKGSRWDWTVEKAVELGASRIVPVLSARCIVRIAPSERDAKADRWRRVAADAVRQCDARWLPQVEAPVDFAAALALARTCARVFAGALTTPPAPPFQTALAAAGAPHGAVGAFIGPEGDFTPDELAALLAFATPVSFGPTVLRAETAALYALSVLSAWTASFPVARVS